MKSPTVTGRASVSHLWTAARVALVSLILASPSFAGDAFKWSVQYLIDNSRTVFGRSQKISPRNNRGLAISPDGKYLYAGYNHSLNNSGEVRRISLQSNNFERATVALLPGPAGKAIATDEKGRVYITDDGAVLVYDPTLRQRQAEINVNDCDGVVVTREEKDLVLYTSNRKEGSVHRWILQEKDGSIVSASSEGLPDNGEIKIPGAVDLRQMAVDKLGNVWVADHDGNQVYRIGSDHKTISSADVMTPMGVAVDNDRIYVTRSHDLAITILDENMTVVGNLAVPWEELELSPLGNAHRGSLSGIVVLPGQGFFVANESGQTANQRSTYGEEDDHSGTVEGKLYKDAFEDDNDPILRAMEVTTAQ